MSSSGKGQTGLFRKDKRNPKFAKAWPIRAGPADPKAQKETFSPPPNSRGGTTGPS